MDLDLLFVGANLTLQASRSSSADAQCGFVLKTSVNWNLLDAPGAQAGDWGWSGSGRRIIMNRCLSGCLAPRTAS